MKRLIFLFFFITLLAIGVNATGVSVDIDTIDNLIMVDEEAIFDVTIKNEQSMNDKFTFVISDLDWEWEKKFFVISSGMSEVFQLKLKAPKDIIGPNRYSLNLKIYSTNDENVYVYEPILVTVLDESSLLKLEKIDYSVNGLDPNRENNILKVIIKNQYDKSIDDVNIYLISDIFDEVSKKVDFNEAELKTEDFFVKLNSVASEGLHDVNVLLKRGDDILLDDVKKIKIGSYSNIKEDKEISFGFLIKRVNILRKNEGSILSEETYRLRLNSFEKLFSDVNPEPSFVEKSGDDYYYVWTFDLNPGEEYEIYTVVNYRDPLFLLIILIIIIWLIIYLSESGISIRKRVLTIKSKEGISYMKVLLLIKNKGKREIKNVRIVDQLFNVKTVPKDYGTLRPSKINRKGNSVVLVWDGISLMGKEERILSYRVNVEVKTSIRLPSAMVRYKRGKKSIFVKSNSSLIVS